MLYTAKRNILVSYKHLLSALSYFVDKEELHSVQFLLS